MALSDAPWKVVSIIVVHLWCAFPGARTTLSDTKSQLQCVSDNVIHA